MLHEQPIFAEATRETAAGARCRSNSLCSTTRLPGHSVFLRQQHQHRGCGAHLTGFRTALTRSINQFGQQAGLFKDVKENLTGDDVREGLVGVISVKLPQPQFEGTDQGKLNSDIANRSPRLSTSG